MEPDIPSYPLTPGDGLEEVARDELDRAIDSLLALAELRDRLGCPWCLGELPGPEHRVDDATRSAVIEHLTHARLADPELRMEDLILVAFASSAIGSRPALSDIRDGLDALALRGDPVAQLSEMLEWGLWSALGKDRCVCA